MKNVACITIFLIFLSNINSCAYGQGIQLYDPKGQLIMTTTSGEFNSFTLGSLAPLVLIPNIVLSFVCFLYIKNKIPEKIKKSIKLIYDFEISKKITFLTIATILIIYLFFSVWEVGEKENFGDSAGVIEYYENFKKGKTSLEWIPLAFLLIYLSEIIFQNVRVIALILSIGILLLTYGITVQLSKKRFSGVVSLVILLQSYVFLSYDTAITYPSFWIFFYLLSLYLIRRKWYFSPIPFVMSVFTKSLTLTYVPMTLFFIHRAGVSKKEKIFFITIYGSIIIFLVVKVFTAPSLGLNFLNLWQSLVTMFFLIRFDWLVMAFICPLIVGLFLLRKKGFYDADSIMLFIFSIIIISALYYAILDITIQPYRMIPLVIFFAIGIGVILSKINGFHIQTQNDKLISYLIFIPTLSICLIPTITLIFPALFLNFF